LDRESWTIDKRDSQSEKQPLPRTSIDDGTTTLINPLPQNACPTEIADVLAHLRRPVTVNWDDLLVIAIVAFGNDNYGMTTYVPFSEWELSDCATN
jgi:hypothetical protein